MLAFAATAGGDIAAPLLRATSGLAAEDLDLAVGELMAARLFKTTRTGADAAQPRYDLYHDRIREVAYDGLAADRRCALHRRIAAAIEAPPDGGTRDAEVLARHWGAAGERDKQRRYAIEAAERAVEKLAFLRAARLFRGVLDEPAPGEDPLTTASRWERVGDLFADGGLRLDAARAIRRRCSAGTRRRPITAIDWRRGCACAASRARTSWPPSPSPRAAPCAGSDRNVQ